MKLKIKKGDIVEVITGDDKGATGRVLETYPKEQRILVEGVNIHKRHTRPSPQNQKGGIVDKELPMHYSNVMIVDSDKNPTRIRIERQEGQAKRIAATNGSEL
ncbi:MAG: 50S ribosomal protein L24 [Candidatus Kapaibacterium sp.]